MKKFDLSTPCRCDEIEVLQSSEALRYASEHLIDAYTPPGGWRHLSWCRKTGELFFLSSLDLIPSGGPTWLRRVRGIRAEEGGMSHADAKSLKWTGEEAIARAGQLLEHHRDPHTHDRILSDPVSKAIYVFAPASDLDPLALEAVALLRVSRYERDEV